MNNEQGQKTVIGNSEEVHTIKLDKQKLDPPTGWKI